MATRTEQSRRSRDGTADDIPRAALALTRHWREVVLVVTVRRRGVRAALLDCRRGGVAVRAGRRWIGGSDRHAARAGRGQPPEVALRAATPCRDRHAGRCATPRLRGHAPRPHHAVRCCPRPRGLRARQRPRRARRSPPGCARSPMRCRCRCAARTPRAAAAPFAGSRPTSPRESAPLRPSIDGARNGRRREYLTARRLGRTRRGSTSRSCSRRARPPSSDAKLVATGGRATRAGSLCQRGHSRTRAALDPRRAVESPAAL